MIKQEMESLLNDQFHREMFSAMQYLAVTSWFEDQNLDGFAHFFRIQAQEEMSHAMKQFDYLHTVGGKITMKSIPQPRADFSTNEEVFKFALDQETGVTDSINNLMKKAVDTGDFATQTFLQWFVTEQVEEEDLVRKMLHKVRLIGDNTSALFHLNEELLKRQPEPEADGQGI